MVANYVPVAVDNRYSLGEDDTDTHYHDRVLVVKKLRLYLWILGCLSVILVAILSTISYNLYIIHDLNTMKARGTTYSDSLVPEIPEEIIVFQEDVLYAAPSSPESNTHWDRLLPPGRGYIYPVGQKPESMPLGEPTPWGEIYSVTVFHQLHCLGLLRSHWYMLLDASEKSVNNTTIELEDLVRKLRARHHINHCFDYLRQGISCGGDLTLEWPRGGDEPGRNEVDGWGVQHRCRNWESIMEFMEATHYNGSQRTDIA